MMASLAATRANTHTCLSSFARGGSLSTSGRNNRPSLISRAISSEKTTAKSSSSTLSEEVRNDFPILQSENDFGMPIVYLDSAATSQKPLEVLKAHAAFYSTSNANVHRGVHYLSAKATDAYEQSRTKVAKFINAKTDREIVFTRNASESLNLIANTWGRQTLIKGMKSFYRWRNITRTSCRGSCWRKGKARC